MRPKFQTSEMMNIPFSKTLCSQKKRALNNGKAAGVDNIPAELVKNGKGISDRASNKDMQQAPANR